MVPYKGPARTETAFNCPNCGSYADQYWVRIPEAIHPSNLHGNVFRHDLDLAFCRHCKDYSLWHDSRMVIPSIGTAPVPNPDLPEEIKKDYEEARSIAWLSPRGAAALLRLAIDKLCNHLGAKGDNLNQKIGDLVANKHLNPKVQKSLDMVRVTGNEAIHPGVIDLKDDTATVGKLFGLVNIIAADMITIPRQVDDLYDEIVPETKKEQIRKRDEAT